MNESENTITENGNNSYIIYALLGSSVLVVTFLVWFFTDDYKPQQLTQNDTPQGISSEIQVKPQTAPLETNLEDQDDIFKERANKFYKEYEEKKK